MEYVTLQRLVTKLRRRSTIDLASENSLLNLPFTLKKLSRSEYLFRSGETISVTYVLLSGFTFRQKVAGDGGRQIVAIQVPGDIVNIQSLQLNMYDHSVQALSDATIAVIPTSALLVLAQSHDEIMFALWLDTFVDASIAWEWITNIGRRNARIRLAHLLCEITLRVEMAGFHTGATHKLAMTSEDIGDALGLTPVHVTRVIKELMRVGLILRERRSISILDINGLRTLADFNQAYLHLQNINHRI